MMDPNMYQVASQPDVMAGHADNSFELTQKADPGDSRQFYADVARYSELERLNNNVFFYNANKLDFSKIDMGNIGDAVLKMAKEGRTAYENAVTELKEIGKFDANSKLSVEDLMKKQFSGFVTTMEIEMTAKLMSKSVENIYILLRQ